MKYTLEIDIALPRATVVGLFDNPDNWSKWQESLVRSEAFEGLDARKERQRNSFTGSVAAKLKWLRR